MTDETRRTSVGLHLGAHKTATTHLQHSLLASQGVLNAFGVQVHGPRSFRWGKPSLLTRFGIAETPKSRPRKPHPIAFEELSQGARRLLLTEENFAGTLVNQRGRLRRLDLERL